MTMNSFRITGPYIKLNQLLKLLGWCSSGAEANSAIDHGKVYVNGMVEKRRRNKIVPGIIVAFEGNSVLIE